MEKVVLKVEGMKCIHCAKRVEDALNAVKGVKKAEVNLEAKEVEVSLKREVPEAELAKAITEAGYKVL